MSFNKFIGKETLKKEFKECTLNTTGCSLDTKQAEEYCKTNKFDFNDEIISNLLQYIPSFFSKYFCGCLNANLKTSNFYIGVDDCGFIKGIPFQGELPKKYLREQFMKSIKNSIKNNSYNFDFNNNIKIKFIKVKYTDNNCKNKMNPEFIKYMKEIHKFTNARNDYIEKLNKWKIRFAFINQKLVDLAKNYESRNMIIEYIRKHNSESSVIDLLLSGYEVKYANHINIVTMKEDPEDPYFWITRWKDETSKIIRSQKPIFTSKFKKQQVPYNLIMNCNEMIPYWMENNDNMKLYVIKITTIKPNIKFGKEYRNHFSYYSLRDKRWTSCRRILLNGTEPSCFPY